MNIDLSKVQKYLKWLKSKLFLDLNSYSARGRIVERGEVYYCNLGVGVGSEEDKDRPCLIIQNDMGNIKSPNTIVAPITNSPGTKAVTVKVTQNRYKYLYKNKYLSGYIALGNIVTVSKGRLGKKVTVLDIEMKEVNEKLLTSIGLYKELLILRNKTAQDKRFIAKINQDNYDLRRTLSEIKKQLKIESDDQIITEIIKREERIS